MTSENEVIMRNAVVISEELPQQLTMPSLQQCLQLQSDRDTDHCTKPINSHSLKEDSWRGLGRSALT